MKLITDILRDIRRGAAVEEATMALANVVKATDETGKAGSVTITITVKPSKHGGPEKVLQCEVKAKTPLADIAPAIFFSDEDGDLHRHDPTQEEMRFTEAPTSVHDAGTGGA